MHILTFETTGRYASVACIDENGRVAEKKSGGEMSHLMSLLPMAESLLKERGIALRDVSCVAASCGPGSFTGIRIGVATARGLAQALNIPCIPVPTLKAFIYNENDPKRLVCPMLDARRGQIYAGAYAMGGEEGEVIEAVAAGAYEIGEYLELAGQAAAGAAGLRLYGDGVERYREAIAAWDGAGGRAVCAEGEAAFQRASSAARLALDIYKSGGMTDFNGMEPEYMRKAEAERKLHG